MITHDLTSVPFPPFAFSVAGKDCVFHLLHGGHHLPKLLLDVSYDELPLALRRLRLRQVGLLRYRHPHHGQFRALAVLQV